MARQKHMASGCVAVVCGMLPCRWAMPVMVSIERESKNPFDLFLLHFTHIQACPMFLNRAKRVSQDVSQGTAVSSPRRVQYIQAAVGQHAAIGQAD